mmetsp:Transcript_44019/g.106733  ORF Transcript_44019/g.106733 Transcript_44019/m.106733 type:complete len:133 (+) Transcript_44019:195-593(+)
MAKLNNSKRRHVKWSRLLWVMIVMMWVGRTTKYYPRRDCKYKDLMWNRGYHPTQHRKILNDNGPSVTRLCVEKKQTTLDDTFFDMKCIVDLLRYIILYGTDNRITYTKRSLSFLRILQNTASSPLTTTGGAE